MEGVCTLQATTEYPCYPLLAASDAGAVTAESSDGAGRGIGAAPAEGVLVNALIEIKTQPYSGPRPTFELALVLDVSGSMAGERIHSLKAAVLAVLDRLHDQDVVHIVAYNSEVQLLASGAVVGQDREVLKHAVQFLECHGGTNISAALSVAANRIQQGQRRLIRRIFLYSDGEPNEGLVDADAFTSLCRGIKQAADAEVSTFGIGEGIDAATMQAIAEGGGGHYDFVSPRRIGEMTERALSGMDRLLGTRGELRILLRPGIALSGVGGDDGDVADTIVGNEGSRCIDIGNVKYDWGKRILLKFRVAPGCAGGVLPIELIYVPALNPLAPVSEIRTDLGIVVEPPQAVFSPTRPRPRDRKVALALSLHAVGAAFAQAATALETRDVAKAQRLIQEAMEDLTQYQQDDSTGIVETQLRRGNRTLQRLQVEGVRGARRAELELGHQAAMMNDSFSDDDFQASRASNRSIVAFVDSGVGGHGGVGSPSSPPRRDSRMFGGSNSPDSPTLSIADDEFLDENQFPPTLGLALPASPPRTIPPLVQPPPLTVAADLDNEDAPEDFFCPLTKAIMRDPVVTADGQTYDREAIEAWFAAGKMTSPLTGAVLPNKTLTPNFALRRMIENYLTRGSNSNARRSSNT